YKIIMISAFLLGRVHSIPVLYYAAAAQQYADYVNLQAMQLASSSGAPRLISLDLPEESQFIQEWNFIRCTFFSGALPPLFGDDLFEPTKASRGMVRYAEGIRDSGCDKESDKGGASHRVAKGYQLDTFPQVGDILTARYGD